MDGVHPALMDPWEAAHASGDGVVIALLEATHGPAYRSAGEAMAIFADGQYVGALSSGCIEADLVLQAREVRGTGKGRHVRYGVGSPFLDMRLPCGGAIEVHLFLIRDADILARLVAARRARKAVALHVSAEGRLSLEAYQLTGPQGEGFTIGFRPPVRFVIFGAGPEASLFASLVRSLGFEHLLVSHEEDSLKAAQVLGCDVRRLQRVSELDALDIDADCATVLFYHDHDHEPMILKYLLSTPAFYIGAQGSRATQATRLARLYETGVEEVDLARIRGPIGLIPSSRDPRTLAVSVLAEIIDEANVLRTAQERVKNAGYRA
ncbi:XdhC family protein [Xanthobacter sp. TB0139]|uniref:XdhC family protein n=1 Tax=Xanthobacter sp. TB0139 TaxID=3459178 RepID=UPI00403A571A